MKIIQGGKEPEPKQEDPFLYDLLLTSTEIDTMLKRKQITQKQYDKLIEEVD